MLIHKQQQKLVNEAANDSAQVSGQDRKKPPAPAETNHIAGFGGFRPLASLGKKMFTHFQFTYNLLPLLCEGLSAVIYNNKRRVRKRKKRRIIKQFKF